MAYSDFQLLFSGSAATPSLTDMLGTSGSGLSIIHSNLSSPLVSSGAGTLCRYNTINGGGAKEGAAHFCITAATSGGAFVNIPSTKGVEIVFSARGTSNGVFSNGTSVGVFTKNVNLAGGTSFGLFGTGSGGEGFYGYGLRLGNLTNYSVTQGTIHVGLWARNANSGTQVNVTSLPGGLGTVAYDKWYTLKLTVTPSGVLQDVLKAYIMTGTDYTDPTHFTEIASLTISNIISYYVPWTTTTQRTGFYFSRGSPTNAGSNNLASHSWFIDRMSFKLKNV